MPSASVVINGFDRFYCRIPDRSAGLQLLTKVPKSGTDMEARRGLDDLAAERKHHLNLVAVCSLSSCWLLSLWLRQRREFRHMPGNNAGD
jgi:hypothetical protein